jgi:hypothetical protein
VKRVNWENLTAIEHNNRQHRTHFKKHSDKVQYKPGEFIHIDVVQSSNLSAVQNSFSHLKMMCLVFGTHTWCDINPMCLNILKNMTGNRYACVQSTGTPQSIWERDKHRPKA